jgi:hypothetical protein
MRKLIDRLDLDGHIRRRDLRRYLLQCTLVGVFVLILLLVLDAVTQTVLSAALALGLALNEWNFLTILVILVILAGIISLSVFKRLVLPVLMDLI